MVRQRQLYSSANWKISMGPTCIGLHNFGTTMHDLLSLGNVYQIEHGPLQCFCPTLHTDRMQTDSWGLSFRPNRCHPACVIWATSTMTSRANCLIKLAHSDHGARCGVQLHWTHVDTYTEYTRMHHGSFGGRYSMTILRGLQSCSTVQSYTSVNTP